MIVEQRNGKIADGEEEEKEVKYSTSRMKDKKYISQPIDTSDVKLSKELEQLADLMSKNVHEVWAETRIMQGWKYGEQRNDELKTHPTRPRILVRQHVKE